MKELNNKEAEQLKELLKRAVSNYQLEIKVASPFDGEGEPWKMLGFDFNDRHDGNSVSGNWNIETAIEELENTEKVKVSIFVDDDSLCFLAGVSTEEADVIVSVRDERGN